ncbi:putative F-box/LRR-repeat protein 23 [Vicia villosa]|uniref:putative F-box/LRR-repeat protein 23 n=1 Tax=Vicia villosa TaxID=3911 RepID=UPI00273C6097|nr:putative F-box/LRR-repeat protein 23 [Vicia villosa]
MASTGLSPVMAIENLNITLKPNWLELPRDITKNILQRLGTLEIVTSASVVCPLWWNICKDPLMWSTIDMFTGITIDEITDLFQPDSYFENFSRLEKICRYAVDRSYGHLKDIYINKFGTDDLLCHIAQSASHLRSMRLEKCYDISTAAFYQVVKNHPFLEELDIFHSFYEETEFFEHIGQSCPVLKSLKFSPYIETLDSKSDDVAFTIAKTMPKLRHLAILNNGLTNNGLLAILDGCPLLESLDVRGCLYLDLDGSLNQRCSEQIKELRFPSDSIDNKFKFGDYAIHVQLRMCSDLDVSDFSLVDQIQEII